MYDVTVAFTSSQRRANPNRRARYRPDAADGVCSSSVFPTSGAGIQLYLVINSLPPPPPTVEERRLRPSRSAPAMVPGRGGGPSLSGGGLRFAIPTGTPAQAFLSSTSVTRSRSEGGGRRIFRVRTPVAASLILGLGVALVSTALMSVPCYGFGGLRDYSLPKVVGLSRLI